MLWDEIIKKSNFQGMNIHYTFQEEVQKAIAVITKCAESKEGNLLDLAVKAARKRATLGEISDAIEKVSGRYKAVTRTISGVYSSEYKGSENEMLSKARELTNEQHRPEKFDKENLREEISDIIMMLIVLASEYDIDLSKEFESKLKRMNKKFDLY